LKYERKSEKKKLSGKNIFSLATLSAIIYHFIFIIYISELISIKAQSAYSLSSANGILLSPSIIKTRKTLGDRAFQVEAPQLWNALPLELRQNTNISSFKRCLKTHLFGSAFQRAQF